MKKQRSVNSFRVLRREREVEEDEEGESNGG